MDIIRSSKHNITNITNVNKVSELNKLFSEYKVCLNKYIDDILSGKLELVRKMSSKKLPTYNIVHSKYKRDIYIKASEIIRSQIKKANNKRYIKYKYVYKYFKTNNRQTNFINKKFNELNLKNVQLTKYFTRPNITNFIISLTNEFYDIKTDSSFDEFISIKLPFMNEKGTRALKVKIPIKYHRHSNKLNQKFNRRNNINLYFKNNEIYIGLIWGKNQEPNQNNHNSIGIDMGYKKLITTNRGEILGKNIVDVYEKISRRVQGSKSFNKSLTERDNLINYYLNNLDVTGLSHIFIEDLKNVKKNSRGKINRSFNNKLQRWSYLKAINKLERMCSDSMIDLVKVSPRYTSQICSKCGSCDKKSRIKEDFNCTSCGYEIDADINAAINIHNRGVYSLSN